MGKEFRMLEALVVILKIWFHIVSGFLLLAILLLLFVAIMKLGGKNPNFELNMLFPGILAVLLTVMYWIIGLFVGPLSVLSFQ